MENSNNSGKMIGSFLIGAVVGGALGILFAPHKGSVTRRMIAGETEELTDSLKEKFDTLLENARKEFEAAKENVRDFAENGKSK